MKKTLFVLFALIFVFSICVFANGGTAVNIVLNGEQVSFTDDSGYPFIDENNRTMVPLRVTMESAGFVVDYDENTHTAIVITEHNRIEVPIGTNIIYADSKLIRNDTISVVKNGRTFLPIRAVLEAAGFTVEWDGDTQSVKAFSSQNNTLVVALEDFAPFSYKENGQFYGIHVDIAKELADRLDLNVRFVQSDFDDLIIGVNEGRYDMAFGLENTSQRQEVVMFTEPYYDGMCAIFKGETFDEYSSITSAFNGMIEDGTIENILSTYDEYLQAPQDYEYEDTYEDDSNYDYYYKTTCLAVGCDNSTSKLSSYCNEHACANVGCSFKKDYNSEYCSSCQCLKVGCHDVKSSGGFYCEEHTCEVNGCNSEKYYRSEYCFSHKCMNCENIRVDDGFYCEEHTCSKRGCTSNRATSSSEYCILHQCLAGFCKECRLDGGQYCEEHTCIVPGCLKQKLLDDYCYYHS